MPTGKVVYQNWIAELGIDPVQIKKLFEEVEIDSTPDDEIDREVRRAIEGLDDEEMEFVIRYYFMGQSYQDISDKSGRAIYKLEALNKRAVRKLKSKLKKLVKSKFGISHKTGTTCPICESLHKKAINEVIFEKDDVTTWRPVMKEINERFGLRIKSPQVLIGHRKYHG